MSKPIRVSHGSRGSRGDSAIGATVNTTAPPTSKKVPRVYSEQEIAGLLEGQYIVIHPTMWDHIPVGAHVRYFVTGDEPPNVRFRRGGFVRDKFVTPGGKKAFRLGYSKFGKGAVWTVEYDTVARICKKYDLGAFIEIHMISISLAEKKQQIAQLQAAVRALQEEVRELRTQLTS